MCQVQQNPKPQHHIVTLHNALLWQGVFHTYSLWSFSSVIKVVEEQLTLTKIQHGNSKWTEWDRTFKANEWETPPEGGFEPYWE